MAELIDQTYFQKRLTAIPNLNEPFVLAQLNNYLDIYEDEYLVKILGQELRDEFITGLSETVVDQKWKDLRDGVSFTYTDGVKYKWKGFLTSTKESPIANYVMWYIVRDGNDTLTGIGVVKSTGENSEVISPVSRMVNIYNQMVYQNRILEKFLITNATYYPNYCPQDTLTVSTNVYGI